MSVALSIIFLVIFLLCSAILSASETALFSLSSMQVKTFRKSSDRRKRVVSILLSRPRKLLVTILMLNVFCNILVQNMVSGIFGTFSNWTFTVLLPLALVLIFGEILPKTIALSINTKIAYRIAPTLLLLEKFLKWIRDPISRFTSVLSKVFFFYLRPAKEISNDELKHALHQSRDYGVLSKEEVKIVRGYLNLDEELVSEIMSPRQEIIFYEINDPLQNLIHLFVDKECSRIPVCEGDLEKLLGIITSETFFLHQGDIHSSEDLKKYLTKPHFVPENMEAKWLLRDSYESDNELMVAVDEYGSISGILTFEDIVEVVIGQIADKRDEKTLYTRSSEDVIISSGKLELTELEDLFDVHLESPNNMVTVGGFLTEMIGDIPRTGTKYVTDAFLFHVLAADHNRVRRVYIRRLRAPKQVTRKKR